MSINNISDNTISGSVESINQSYKDWNISTGQSYCLIIGFTLIAITLILVIGKIVQTAILKINVLTKKQIEYIIESVKEELEDINK